MSAKKKLLSVANKFLGQFNFKLVREIEDDKVERERWIDGFLLEQSKENQKNILMTEHLSKSQLKQDLFVLSELNFKRDGFFVEFGAANGVDYSNSYLLETEFGWNGILSEPARGYHAQLEKNRNCSIEQKCVWIQSGEELEFVEARDGMLSTLNEFVENDFHQRIKKKRYKVSTISLRDMLIKHNAPKDIDYLSIDTEGSEFDILQNFDFNDYNIKIITVEHNINNEVREKIFDLLTNFGYERKYTDISAADDWYVRERPGHLSMEAQ